MEELICTYQQNHLSITQPEGKITPCCHFDNKPYPHWDEVNLNSVNSLSKLLKSYRWFELRDIFSEGIKYEGCINFWNAEKIGYLSKREYYNLISEKYEKEKIEDLILHPDKIKFHIPSDTLKKIEYLYDFAKMIWANGKVDEYEEIALKKFCLKFGFEKENITALAKFLIEEAEKGTAKTDIFEIVQQNS